MSENLYSALSEERKRLQAEGLVPLWYSTGGYQMFKDKYEYDTKGRSVRGQFERIAKTAAKHVFLKGYSQDVIETKFFGLLWDGWLSPSTPVLANMGTNRGLPISCSGSVVDDSIYGFYYNQLETAMLTKNGFGTSSYMGDIRNRGAGISIGGKASGMMPVYKDHVNLTRDVSQGTARRGAWAGYLDIEHGDFDELADFILAEPDDANVGWNISDNFLKRLDDPKDFEALRRFQKVMKLKMTYGKGYFLFPDKINRVRPNPYKEHELFVKASNLCSEITLFADKDHTFTCVLSSMNVARFNEWKGTDAVFWATVFLDAVVSEFLERARTIPGLEKAVRFTEKGRALGLGACGLHTYFQDNMMAWDSMEAHFANMEIFDHINKESRRASVYLAEEMGEPFWCKGHGIRNTHRMAIAPTKSTALLMGGVSEGINPDPAMSFTQLTSAGEVERVNPALLKIMKDRGVHNKKTLKVLKDRMGSVQQFDWLSDDEKRVFRTAFEIPQEAIIRMASTRAQYLDQWQSLNLFFPADASPRYIAKVHKLAFLDPRILGLYYVYTSSGVTGATEAECAACM
jgi:ribonucleoside-diphosphate reductase alpha chain